MFTVAENMALAGARRGSEEEEEGVALSYQISIFEVLLIKGLAFHSFLKIQPIQT